MTTFTGLANSGFEIQIMDEETFRHMCKGGRRRGYVCHVTKDVRKISAEKCANWFEKNHEQYRTKLFVMITKRSGEALILGFRLRQSGCFVDIPVYNIEMKKFKGDDFAAAQM